MITCDGQTRLTTPAMLDVAWRKSKKMAKFRVWDTRLYMEVGLLSFFGVPEFPDKPCRISRGKPLRRKQLDQFGCVDVQYRRAL